MCESPFESKCYFSQVPVDLGEYLASNVILGKSLSRHAREVLGSILYCDAFSDYVWIDFLPLT
jgi:hypothetical protein